jgi:hypothetical protein
MPVRVEFHYRPALVRKMTISAAEGAIVGAAITYFVPPSDNVLLGALIGAVSWSGMTLLFDLNTRRRARRARVANDAAYQVALAETRAGAQERSPATTGIRTK